MRGRELLQYITRQARAPKNGTRHRQTFAKRRPWPKSEPPSVTMRSIYETLWPLLIILVVLQVVWWLSHRPDPAPAATKEATVKRPLDMDEGSSSPKDRHPIAWLLSFPNSGTSYTIINTMIMSNKTTASNYGHEARQRKSSGERVWSDTGPYLLDDRLARPTVTLTKSHCSTSARTYGAFEHVCRSTTDDVDVPQVYDGDLVDRVVHLVRHPLDNLVARKHLIYRHASEMGDLSAEQIERFGDTREGFLAWCRYYDRQRAATFAQSAQSLLNDLRQRIPCVTDLIEYVKWHNFATNLTASYQRPVHVLHYEDYGLDYNTTVDHLLHFLNLSAVAEPLPFTAHSYHDYYTEAHRAAVSDLLRYAAEPAVMELLHRYFDAHGRL